MGPGSGRSSSSSTGSGSSSSSSSGYSPFMLNVLAGGGAGVVETALTFPLDLARTRVQMAQAGGGGGVLAVLRSIVETEGGLRQLYRGLLPPLVSEVPRRALKFTANDAYTRVLVGHGGGGGFCPAD